MYDCCNCCSAPVLLIMELHLSVGWEEGEGEAEAEAEEEKLQ